MTIAPILRIALATVAVALFVLGRRTAVFHVARTTPGCTSGPEARLRVLVCDRGLWIATTTFVDGKPIASVERYRNWDDMDDLTLRDPDGRTTYTLHRPQSLRHRPARGIHGPRRNRRALVLPPVLRPELRGPRSQIGPGRSFSWSLDRRSGDHQLEAARRSGAGARQRTHALASASARWTPRAAVGRSSTR